MRPGGKREISISFKPEEAKVIISTAVFTFTEGDKTCTKVLKMSGIGKYPYVNLSDDKLNFESLTVGKSLSKTVELRNHSQVTACFTIEKINDDGKDVSFKLSKESGTIVPGSSTNITVTYEPSLVGSFSNTQYSIKILGGNDLKLSCSGQALGSDVCLSSKSIHFGEVQLQNTTNRLLNIINESD